MPLYRIDNKKISSIPRTTFAQQGIKERFDLQSMLRQQVDIIAPDTLIVSEEFGQWEDSGRRIDLLGIDKDANLVVIELKRTEDGGHMDLQAIRYAAMISTLTFDKLVPIYDSYLKKIDSSLDATSSILEFLEWNEPDEDHFAQSVKIVLVAAEFSKELTTSVMWLNESKLDIRCVRMHPYFNDNQILLDVQTVIPLPEVAHYQVQISDKRQKERESRTSLKDFTKFNLTILDMSWECLAKRWLMFHLVTEAIKHSQNIEKICSIIPARKLKIYEGHLSAEEIYDNIMSEGKEGTATVRSSRFFINEGEFLYIASKTCVISNQWGDGTLEWADQISKAFPELKIKFEAVPD